MPGSDGKRGARSGHGRGGMHRLVGRTTAARGRRPRRRVRPRAGTPAHLAHRPGGSARAARLPARRPHRAVGDRRARLRPRHDADHPPRRAAGAVRRRQSARRRRGQRRGHRARPRGGAPGRNRARYLVRQLDRGVRQRRRVGPAPRRCTARSRPRTRRRRASTLATTARRASDSAPASCTARTAIAA